MHCCRNPQGLPRRSTCPSELSRTSFSRKMQELRSAESQLALTLSRVGATLQNHMLVTLLNGYVTEPVAE